MSWTPEMDRKLLAGVKRGRSRGQMAKELGVSRFAAIARYNRLQGIVFPSDAKRERIEREEARRRARVRAKQENKALADMQRRMKAGMPRSSACRLANLCGASWRAIGRTLGMSHEGARIFAVRHHD